MSDRSPAVVERRTFLRYSGALGAAAAITASLSACGGPASTNEDGSSESQDDSTLEAGISYSLSTGFDPMITSGATPYAANMHAFEGLVDLDPVTLKARPALATEPPQRINATTYRATLRSGATFHDGSPVTSKDVVFSFERILEPDNASFMAQFIPFVDTVKAVDELTVEFKLKYPFALFPSRISVAKIVPKKLVERDVKAFDAKPVGSGPYRIVEATPEDKIVFAAHRDYNGPHPARAGKMVWRLMTDPSARVSALESGRVHVIEDVPYIDISRVKKEASTASVQSFGLLFLMFNCAREPFDDKRVRQALHYGLDTRKIIDTGLLGGGAAATGYLQEGHPDYRRAASVYTYDPDKAKRLLADAGATDLSLTLLLTDTGWVKDIAPILKESWETIGVEAQLDIAQSPAQYAKVDQGTYDALVAPGDPSVFGNDADLLLRWYYSGLWPESRFGWGEDPAYKKVNRLLGRAARTAGAEERKKLWGQVTDLVADEAPLYPILHRELPTAWDDKALSGFKPLSTTGVSFLDVGRA